MKNNNGLRSVGIIGTGSEVPPRVVTNADLEKMVDTNDEWIRTRTGISERRIADPDMATSDLAVGAARKALAAAGVKPEELDLIIVATVTPDTLFPSASCVVQDRIGARKAAAFDLSAGCSGFVYALSTASQFIAAGTYDKVLVIGAEMLSRITDWEDRSTCVLFGDAAGAVVLAPVEDGKGFLSFELGAEGGGGKHLILPAGGSRLPASARTVADKQHFIKMAGNEVFKFAVRIMGEAAVEVLEKAGLKSQEVDLFIPHQANIRIIEAAAKRLGLGMDRVFVNVQKYGNTSAASIGLALDEAVREGRVQSGDLLVLMGFGAGLTWAAAALRWV
ncbi:MAG: ketoacyl-ACP synthase III [Firmicutes bacterium]|nr:ketoacyl-ACP synthase III [Bacillota bacterium]